MNTSAQHEVEALDTLLADLGMVETPPDEIVEAAESVCETTLEAAVASAEAQEIVNAAQDDDETAEVIEEVAADPLENPETLVSDAPVTKPEKKAKPVKTPKVKAEKVAKAPKVKAEKPAKEPKAPKVVVPRKHYASKAERVTDKLGATLGDYLVLEMQDAALEGDELAAKQGETMAALKSAGIKVQNRMTFLIEFAAGKSSKLNDIATAALRLLKSDGKITTGEAGNLFTELSKKYAKSSANAMGNNTLGAMRQLKMIVAAEKGEYVANPNSLYLMKINGMVA